MSVEKKRYWPPLAAKVPLKINNRYLETTLLTVGGFGLSRLLAMASNLIIARLLAPEAFGIVAIAFVLQNGLTMFSDVGLNQNAIQSKRGDDQDFLNTLWIVQILRGLLISLIMLGVAALLAFTDLSEIFASDSVYRSPETPGVIALIALIPFIHGCRPTKAISARRHMRIARITLIELIVQVSSAVCTITFALLGLGAWSFAFGAVFGAIVKVVLSNLIIPGPSNSFQFSMELALDIFHFGKWIFLSSICGFLSANGLSIVLSTYLDAVTFGIVTIALTWTRMMTQVLEKLAGSVALPSMSKAFREKSTPGLVKSLDFNYVVLVSLSFVFTIILYLFSQVIDVIYPESYHSISDYLRYTCIAVLLFPTRIITYVWTVQSDTKFVFYDNLFRSVFSLLACIVFLYLEEPKLSILFGLSSFFFSAVFKNVFFYLKRLYTLKMLNLLDLVRSALTLSCFLYFATQ